MSPVCIISALPAEARVFIDAFRLRLVTDSGWRLYAREDYLLLQTGVGKLKAAAATGSLLHSRPDIVAVINAGVAGGMDVKGTCAIAHRITDAGSGAKWYPHLPPQRLLPALQSQEVLTLDQPSSDYQPDVMFDMEAAGVLSAAVNYVSTDAIQCIKVVSDNPESPMELFSKSEAMRLMQAAVEPVNALVDWYQRTHSQPVDHPGILSLVNTISLTVHHTTSDKHQLMRLLTRHSSLSGRVIEADELTALTTARALRQHLETLLASTPLSY